MRKNRFLASLVAVIMVISMMPTTVFAEGSAVAEIDGEEYESLAAAVNAVPKDGTPTTIKLLTEELLTAIVRIEEGQNITLDLNGNAVTVSETGGRSLYAINNFGTFTLTDSSGDGSITARGVENYGTMYMVGGAINSCDSNGGGSAVWNEGKFEMTGGALRFTGKASGTNAGSPFTNAEANATAKITGGTLESAYTALFVNAGTVTVEDITLSTGTDHWMAVKSSTGSELTMTNVTVNAERGGCIEVAGGTAVLTNCTFTQSSTGTPSYNSSAVAVSNGGEVTVKGGTYTASAFGAYVYNSGGTIYIEDGDFEAPKALKADTSTTTDQSKIVISGGGFDGEIVIADKAELTVSGGTFTDEEVSRYLSDTVQMEEDEDGNVQVVPLTGENAVAEINGTYYKTLEAAIAEAQDGETVTLVAAAEEITENITIAADQDITLDLKGKTLNGSVTVFGALEVVDSGVAAAPAVDEDSDYTVTYNSGKIEAVNYPISVQNGGTFTLSSGMVYATGGCAIGTAAEGTVNIEGGYVLAQEFCVHAGQGTVHVSGGVLEARDNAVISSNGSTGYDGYTINMDGGTLIGRITEASKNLGYASCGIYHPNDGTLNISGGKIISTEGAGIVVRSGQTNITGGEIIALGNETFVGKVGDSRVTVPTSGIVLDLAAQYPGTASDEIKVNISGDASVSGAKEALSVIEKFNDTTVTEDDNVNISGGSFSTVVDEDYCAEGFEPVTEPDENGNYTVEIGSDKAVTVTGADGSVAAYDTLEAALAAAKSGDTVTLLEDVELTGGEGNTKGLVTITESITLDGQGHTIKAVKPVKENTSMINIENGAEVTVKNVTIDGSDLAKHGININSAAGAQTQVTVEDVTILNGQGYGIVCNSSVLEATNLTTEGNVWGGVNVDSKVADLGASFTMNSGEIQEKASIVIENDKQSAENAKPVEVEILDGSFENVLLQNIDEDGAADVAIDGGSFNAVVEVSTENGIPTPKADPSEDMVEISGGTFATEVPEVYCADGFHAVAVKTAAGTVYAVMAEEYDFQSVTVKGPNGTDVLDAILTTTENGTLKVVSVQGSGINGALMVPTSSNANWSYQGWTFTASDGTSFGPVKKLTQKLADWLAGKIEDKCTLTMDSKTPGLSTSKPSSSRDDDDDGYSVSVPASSSIKNGSITVSPRNAEKGDTVTVTTKAADGYELETLTVTDGSGKSVKLTDKGNGRFTFTMPASNVRIAVSFVKTGTAAERRFSDVPDGHWAGTEIGWAAEKGYINGTTATTFNPDGAVSRQQLWMILARMSGFQPADFAEAKAWAVDNAVSDGTFPGNAVSRQQLVTILYRWAQQMGYSVSGSADLTVFPDHADVADYAQAPMRWSVANGIVGGTAQGTLNPTGTTTRAQFAVILYRFWENIVNA